MCIWRWSFNHRYVGVAPWILFANLRLFYFLHATNFTNNIFEGIVGIGGSTRSGKTTLSRALYNHYSRQSNTAVYHIGQDSYFRTIKPKQLFGALTFDNWECPEAVDFDRFYNAIISTKNEAQEKLKDSTQYKEALIIVEGFLLFHEERIVNLLDVKYFITIPKQLCHERRCAPYCLYINNGL